MFVPKLSFDITHRPSVDRETKKWRERWVISTYSVNRRCLTATETPEAVAETGIAESVTETEAVTQATAM